MRSLRNIHRFEKTLLGILLLLAFFTQNAHALPSMARQTGMPCSTCHIASFGPSLTPFGRQFKLTGYTMGSGSGFLPLSDMVLGGFTNTQANQSPPPGCGLQSQ